jgi:cell wall assembly regulator SMI1
MQNNLLLKLYKINEWFKQNYRKVYNSTRYEHEKMMFNELSGPATTTEILQLEEILREKIPQELHSLLQTHNGELWSNANISLFFEQNLIDCKEMGEQIKFGLSLLKSSSRHIKNAEKSNQLISQIIDEVKSKLNLSDWYKVSFQGGSTFGMPSIYKNEFNSTERENVRIDHIEANRLVNILKEEEKETYEWDDIEITFFKDGKIEAERNVFDWNSFMKGSASDAVKPIYFHHKWVTVFGDGAGNYIGIDLDPGLSGTKGQVIVYGRDIEQNFKIADNLEQLFDKIIDDLQDESKSSLLQDKAIHFQERLKKL